MTRPGCFPLAWVLQTENCYMRSIDFNPKISTGRYTWCGFHTGLVMLAFVTFAHSPGLLDAQGDTPDKVIQAVVFNEREAEIHRGYFPTFQKSNHSEPRVTIGRRKSSRAQMARFGT